MAFSLNSEVRQGIVAFTEKYGEVAPMPVGDIIARREVYEKLQRVIYAQLPFPDDVTMQDFETPAADGVNILLRWYAKKGSTPGSAVVYAHGGGMIGSTVEVYDGIVARYVSGSGVPFLSVEYRYAPEFQAPVPVTDCYAGLKWLVENAAEVGIDPRRVAIMGDSGGGGVAASLAIYARDRGGPGIAKQILIQPMLDDRNTVPDPLLVNFAPWTYDDNLTGWGALLGAKLGTEGVSPYGAAARLKDFTGLPPAFIEVGELDIFRNESIAYAQGLLSAGVSAELHVHPSVPHAYETFVPTADVSERSLNERRRIIRAL